MFAPETVPETVALVCVMFVVAVVVTEGELLVLQERLLILRHHIRYHLHLLQPHGNNMLYPE